SNDKTNILSVEKSKMIRYQNKYFTYVLVLEDEQQPELVGRIMILSYGEQIKSIIDSEKSGEVTGVKCTVESMTKGKDFILLAKENTFIDNNTGKEVTAPDYTKSRFVGETSTISIPGNSGELRNVPLNENGKIDPKMQQRIADFLLDRDVELESFAGKAWTEE